MEEEYVENKQKYVEKHYWIFKNKEMLAREKEKNYLGEEMLASRHGEAALALASPPR